MPSFPPAKPNDNASDPDPFNFFQATEQLNRPKPAKKKKRKNELAVVEQPRQEAADELVADDEPILSDQQEQDTTDYAEGNSHLSFQKSSKSPRNYTSPVFAALGDAFRDRSLAFDDPPEEHVRESKNLATAPQPAPPQRQDLLENCVSSSPPSRAQPIPNLAEVRGGFSHHSPPPTSPRLAFRQTSRRPSAYQYQQGESLASPPRGRPVSLPSHMFHLPSPSNFNLNQLRGISTDLPVDAPRSTSRKGGKFDYMTLDTFSSAGDETCSSMENVLLVARQRSLHVFRLCKEEALYIGKIEGLRGFVVSAKILPSSNRKGPLHLARPLVAIIVHGPAMPEEDSSRPSSRQSDQSFDPSYPHDARAMPGITKYQTSVEVYSLKQHRHIATLFATRSEEAKIENVFGKTSYEPPPPIGSLSLHVTDGYIAVVSNESGEIYIFDSNSGRSEQPFRCIGKTWTGIPVKNSRSYSSSSTPDMEPSRDGPSIAQSYDAPLLALQGRLLVYVPPMASSRSTIFGRVKVVDTRNSAPGLRSHTASSQPQVTCQLETPLDGSKVNDIARGVTQEMLKGAKWVGDQGVQAWKSYWTSKSQDLNTHVEQNTNVLQFPPTHALDDPQRQVQRPTIVSFLDLQKLSESQAQKPESALQPAASFSLPGGCSFLSFSPSGIALFTASEKGDIQNVWDIMQVIYPKKPTSRISSVKDDHSAVVRQIARFTRVTTAKLVDVSWLSPRGTKLAILTDRGTVHIHDLPHNALVWPPRDIVPRSLPRTEDQESTSQSTTPKGWSSAFSAVSSSAQTISAAVRTNPLAQFSNFNLAEASAGAGAKGGRIVAAGLSRSVEAASGTVSSIMSIGETRLHIPGSSRPILPGSTRWWLDDEDEAIAVVGEGLVRVHDVVLKKEAKRGKRKYSVVGERLANLAISDIPTRRDTDWEAGNDGLVVTGEWLIGTQARKHSTPTSITDVLSTAELEINSPCQVPHADRRMEFESFIQKQSNVGELNPKVFGQAILTEPLSFALQRHPGHEPESRLGRNLILPTDDALPLKEDPPFLENHIEEAPPFEELPHIAESPPKRKSKRSKAPRERQPSPPPVPWPVEDDNFMNDLI